MVRKPTAIMLIVLALLIVLVFYLQKNPLPSAATQTPSATAPVQIIQGLNSSNITWMELKEKDNPTVTVSKDAQSVWMVGDKEKKTADTAKAEQLRGEIAAMRALAVLPAGSPLADIGLDNPTYILTVRTAQNGQFELRVGKKTSIGNGYYLQVDSQPPIVVDKAALETVVDLMKGLMSPATEAAPQTDPLVLPTTGP